jgi:hypothetical protein
VRLDLVGLPEPYVDSAAVRAPARYARAEALVGILNALVVLLFVLVLIGVGVGVAAEPELLDELVALFVGLERLEGAALLVVFFLVLIHVQPLLVNALQFLAFLLLVRVFLLPLLRERRRIDAPRNREDQNEAE